MKMTKRMLVIVLALIMIFTMTGCGNKAKVKEALVGTWGYIVDSVDGDCYQFYAFEDDDTYESLWHNVNASWKNAEHEGTYKIKGSEIVLTDEEGEVESVIEYTYEDGVLELIDRHSDGSGNRTLVKIEE